MMIYKYNSKIGKTFLPILLVLFCFGCVSREIAKDELLAQNNILKNLSNKIEYILPSGWTIAWNVYVPEKHARGIYEGAEHYAVGIRGGLKHNYINQECDFVFLFVPRDYKSALDKNKCLIIPTNKYQIYISNEILKEWPSIENDLIEAFKNE